MVKLEFQINNRYFSLRMSRVLYIILIENITGGILMLKYYFLFIWYSNLTGHSPFHLVTLIQMPSILWRELYYIEPVSSNERHLWVVELLNITWAPKIARRGSELGNLRSPLGRLTTKYLLQMWPWRIMLRKKLPEVRIKGSREQWTKAFLRLYSRKSFQC